MARNNNENKDVAEYSELAEGFYKKYFAQNGEGVRLSLEALRELKEEGVTTEQFLDYLCQKQGLLLHGSIHQIESDKLTSKNKKIFATNKSAIAIERSLYSNVDVNLEYPYFINDENPLILKIHTRPNGKFMKKDTGFVYVVKSDGFKNEPENSWQFVRETDEVDYIAVVETENSDFTYPVEVFNDFEL
jgi:hypothetical protein